MRVVTSIVIALALAAPALGGETAPCATAEDVARIIAEVTTQPHYLCRVRADGQTIRCKGLKVVVPVSFEDEKK